MKNKQLSRYVKSRERVEPKSVTSINIETRQLSFLKRMNLNLSLIVREVIDKLMKEEVEVYPDEK